MISSDSSSSSTSSNDNYDSEAEQIQPQNSLHDISRYFYELLGAPTFLLNRTSINTEENGFQYSSEKYDNDNDTFHNLQPWKRSISDLKPRQIYNHAEYICDEMRKADRARLIYYFNGSLGRALMMQDQYCTQKKRKLLSEEHLHPSPYIHVDVILEENDVSERNGKATKKVAKNDVYMKEAKLKMEQVMEEMKASPLQGYCAPFSPNDIHWCLGSEEELHDTKGEVIKTTQKRKVTKQQSLLEEQPVFYGNCLELLSCNCRCTKTCMNDKGGSCPSRFLLYPKRESLAISKINLPISEGSSENSFDESRNKINTQIDVGGRIMQLVGCFDARKSQSLPQKTLSVVRTPSHCVVISCEAQEDEDDDYEEVDITQSETRCTRKFVLKKVASVKFHSERDDIDLDPIYIAARRQNSTSHGGTEPTFATVGKSSTDLVFGAKGPTGVHFTTCHTNSATTESGIATTTRYHRIRNVASISQIEFSHMHPMVLWSAARSNVKQTLYMGKGHFKRPVMGYGHSLHSLDLRSNQASFVWSPSDDEFVPTSMYSISGMMMDEERPHSLFVSSWSAVGKLYHIDARMPAKTVSSWALPGLCNDNRSRQSPSGMYGSGMLLTRPFRCGHESTAMSLPILGVSQEPGSFGLHLYQKPEKLGNFQTRNMERMAHCGLDSMNNVVTSSFFPQPHVFESSFSTGIVAFYTPVSSLMNEATIEALEYERNPGLALCVISATYRGDLLSYTMLACPERQEGKAKKVRGGPFASCAIPLPDFEQENDQHFSIKNSTELKWSLNNRYPDASCQRESANAASIPKSQYCILSPDKTLDETNTGICTKNLIELEHPQPNIFIGPSEQRPPQKRPLSAFVPKNRPAPSQQKRNYPIKHPSENLRGVIHKLRESNKSAT